MRYHESLPDALRPVGGVFNTEERHLDQTGKRQLTVTTTDQLSSAKSASAPLFGDLPNISLHLFFIRADGHLGPVASTRAG